MKVKPHKRLAAARLAREESDAGAQFAIGWAEANGYSVALFRREGGQNGRVVMQLGPSSRGGVRTSISKLTLSRSILAGVIFLDVQARRRRDAMSSLPWLRALEG
ncbi:MAG TPA: hypothetical protein VGM91_09165 [Conexibacter sp.]|jgi:hypothetical protein